MSEIKNDVIEKQYEELKNGIKFRIKNNITDDWEQHYHCIDVLCEKHKERIKDIENGICVIEKLEKQLAEKDTKIERLKQDYDEVWEDTLFRVEEEFKLNNNCNECRRYYAEEFNKQLSNAIIPKFERQEHIYCFAFGEIKEFMVVAYLDNNTTLCEDTTTNRLELCDNNFLVLTKEEAEAKLKEKLKSE